MTFKEIRNSLSFRNSESFPERRECLFFGHLVADYEVILKKKVQVTLYDVSGTRVTNVMFSFVPDAVNIIVLHVDKLIRSGQFPGLVG